MTREIAERVVALAESWIPTPYHHRAALKGAGCDCLGLVAGIAAELYGVPLPAFPLYTRDWNETTGRESFAEQLGESFEPIAIEAARPGDLLLFRMLRRPPAKHIAILAEAPSGQGAPWRDGSIIDSREIGGVCRRPLDRALKSRTAFAYRFPQTWPRSS